MIRTLVIAALVGVFAIASHATTVRPPDFAELVNGADYVVRAKVRSVSYESRQRNGKSLVFTKVELDVTEVISGTPPQPLVLQMLGGKTEDQELVVHGSPQFKVGDDDILFVQGNGRNFSPLYAVMHGRYQVKQDPKTGHDYVTRSNGVPLTDVAEVALPVAEGASAQMQQRAVRASEAFTPTEFAQLIRATKAAGGGKSIVKQK